MSANEMTDYERLLHYVLGIVQGKVKVTDEDNPLTEAWKEYQRLGHNPLAEPWPVVTLAPPLPPEVLEATASSYEALHAHVAEHGMTPEAHAALTGMARLLGVTPPVSPADQRRAQEREVQAEQPPVSLLEDAAEEGLCPRCRIMDDLAVRLIEQDGEPWCPNCQTNGSLDGLRG
jgi:hypothetical protein